MIYKNFCVHAKPEPPRARPELRVFYRLAVERHPRPTRFARDSLAWYEATRYRSVS